MMHPSTLPCPTCKTEVPVRQDDCQECGMKIRVTDSMSMSPVERLRGGLQLMEAGIEHYRQWITGKHPQASEPEIEAMVQAWLLHEEGPPPPGLHVRLIKETER